MVKIFLCYFYLSISCQNDMLYIELTYFICWVHFTGLFLPWNVTARNLKLCNQSWDFHLFLPSSASMNYCLKKFPLNKKIVSKEWLDRNLWSRRRFKFASGPGKGKIREERSEGTDSVRGGVGKSSLWGKRGLIQKTSCSLKWDPNGGETRGKYR